MNTLGKNNEDIQKINRATVLHFLQKEQVCTRVEISQKIGLKQATITKIIAEMMESGLVSEIGIVEGKKGRRAIGITLNADKYAVIGVKIARHSFDVAVFDIRNKVLKSVHQNIDKGQSANEVVDLINDTIKSMMQLYGNILGIGIAVPGPYLKKAGRIAVMSEFSGWEKIDIYEAFTDKYNIPVCIEHDANAGAMSLWGSSPHDSGVLINFLASEGIGAGIVVDGSILRGVNGIAGEIGHMSINYSGQKCICGNYGCLEGYCSSLAFADRVKKQVKSHPESLLYKEKEITTEKIFECMRSGDKFCIAAVQEVGKYIGYGIANLVYLYDPREVVITDIMTGGGEIMLNSVCAAVRERVLPIIYQNLTIRLERSSVDAILSGAAAVIIEYILNRPNLLYKSGNVAN